MKNNALITVTCIAAMISLSACATGGAGHTPIVDAPKTPQYYADVADCQALARQRKLINGDTQTAALIGAAGGALVRGLSDKDDTDQILGGALAGAAIGGGAGMLSAYGEQKDIVLRCMSGRGYRVLG